MSDKTFRVVLVSDFPPKRAVMSCKSSDTFVSFRKLAGTALELDPKKLEEYDWATCMFRTTPKILLTHAEEKSTTAAEKATLSDFNLSEGAVVFARAPASVKPVFCLIKKKEEKEEEKEKKKEVNVDAESKKYAGLTKKNILTKLAGFKDNKNKKKTALEYIEMYTRPIMKSTAWLALKKEDVAEILKCDKLNASELFIFKYLLEWGKAEAKRQKLEVLDDTKSSSTDDDEDEEEKSTKKKKKKGDEDEDEEEEKSVKIKMDFISSVMKKVLGDLFNLIRFPTMPVSDIAGAVASTSLLEQEQLLALFTHIGQRSAMSSSSSDKKKEKIPPLDACLKGFNAVPRVPREPIGLWSWDQTRMGTQLQVNGKTVKQISGTSQWNTINCKQWISSGIRKVKFKIVGDPSRWIFLGACGRSYSGHNDTSSGYLGSGSNSAWGWSDASGNATLYPAGRTYGRAFMVGDTVEMTINMDDKTISYKINGEENSWGTAFTSIDAEVSPAVTLYNSGDEVQLV
eukprot:TRINITY_DN194_c2_g1_i1.p1 TRINITY_DN194_c2_g1~~TRINITY_DN194_c2_g1_i1.p1  ORF type:complete len:513 (+),score=165.36 TRINITY_DN194_c2_g1_i1:23-1561(+)